MDFGSILISYPTNKIRWKKPLFRFILLLVSVMMIQGWSNFKFTEFLVQVVSTTDRLLCSLQFKSRDSSTVVCERSLKLLDN